MEVSSSHTESFARNGSTVPVTQPFRDEHRNIDVHLERLQQIASALPTVLAPERPKLFVRLIEGLRAHIVPHAQWEEQVLYPLIDSRACTGALAFTASARHEHRIVERWIGQLEQMAAAAHPDPYDFAVKTQQLLGLILAHFEVEEEVLLPVLDATLSAEEFDRLVGQHLHSE